jgi:hypothetical protein
MNVGIEKESSDILPFFFHSFKGVDSTVGTADMEENFHLLETVSSNTKVQTSNKCQNPK